MAMPAQYTTRSATHPKATEKQADACRDQYGLERPFPDVLLDAALDLLHFVSPLFTILRGILAQLSEFLLSGILGDFTHFLKVLSYLTRLFTQPTNRGSFRPRAMGGNVSFCMDSSIDGSHNIPFIKMCVTSFRVL